MKCIFYNLIIVVITLSSCSEEIPFSDVNFDNTELKYDLSVDGFISNEKNICKFTLRKPQQIAERVEIVPVNDASVILKHYDETYYFQFDSNGIYYSIDSIAGIAGHLYTLEITYNGKTYFAKEIMPSEPDDEFYIPLAQIIYFEDDAIVNLNVPIHNFGYSKTNVWAIVPISYNNRTIPSDTSFHNIIMVYTHKGNIAQAMFPIEKISTGPSGQPTDRLIIIKGEVSEGYNQYIIDKFTETWWQGGMFSTIPGNVSTNLSEGATGYFYAVSLKRKRYLIKDFMD